MSIWDGIGYILGKLPIQNRLERIKNKIETLERERVKLIGEPWDEKKARRIDLIDISLMRERRLLSNSSNSK